MRDLLIALIVAAGALSALRRPWIGVLLWAWLSLMNPHRYTYGFAYDAPFALVAAASTMAGLFFTLKAEWPVKGAPVAFFLAFTVWITISWLMGLDPAYDMPQWEKVMKINVMIIVGLALLRTREQIHLFAWVCAMSLALLGMKGGLFTVLTGGNYKVWGPDGSFIGDNNEFALALIMTIPLVRFLQLQMPAGGARHAMSVVGVLCAAAALGSHSRGALVAISAMTLVLWWRGRSRLLGGVALALVAVSLVAFMPESWSNRMSGIEEYQEDNSALGRFSAWWVSWRVAQVYPFGVGFNLARPELFAAYSPYPELGTPVAHSIYFQVLGHHGFVGLTIFVLIWITTWRAASKLRSEAAAFPEASWCADLGAMSQVALVGYLVGGAFLSLSYFDLPYNIMSLVVLARVWLRKRAWENEPKPPASRWRMWLGVVPTPAPPKEAAQAPPQPDPRGLGAR